MVYDLLNPIELQQFKTKADFFVEKAKKKADERTLDNMLVVELKEKHPQRTIQQNRYLWVTITYVAIEEGYPKDNVEQFFKEVNRDIFLREKKNKKGEPFNYWRHIPELDKEEMSVAIDRWLQHCARDRGLYIPTPEDHAYLQWLHHVEKEEELNKSYL